MRRGYVYNAYVEVVSVRGCGLEIFSRDLVEYEIFLNVARSGSDLGIPKFNHTGGETKFLKSS